jgi:hypothetical protein
VEPKKVTSTPKKPKRLLERIESFDGVSVEEGKLCEVEVQGQRCRHVISKTASRNLLIGRGNVGPACLLQRLVSLQARAQEEEGELIKVRQLKKQQDTPLVQVRSVIRLVRSSRARESWRPP